MEINSGGILSLSGRIHQNKIKLGVSVDASGVTILNSGHIVDARKGISLELDIVFFHIALYCHPVKVKPHMLYRDSKYFTIAQYDNKNTCWTFLQIFWPRLSVSVTFERARRYVYKADYDYHDRRGCVIDITTIFLRIFFRLTPFKCKP